jgi:hypothetical protein
MKQELNYEFSTDDSAFSRRPNCCHAGRARFTRTGQEVTLEFLSRHLRGDWGELWPDDKTENEPSLKHGYRLMSSYQVTEAEKLWIITEADRSVTTLLLPTEY